MASGSQAGHDAPDAPRGSGRRNSVEHCVQLMSAQHRVLALLASGHPFQEVLDAIVESVENACAGTMASILILDPDRRHLRHGSARRLPDDYNRAVDGIRIGPAVGCCGTAAYRGERVVVREIAGDPLWNGFTDLAESHGLRACWSQPIFSSKRKVLGTFAMYYGEPREPSAADVEYIEAAANLAGIAIERERSSRSRQAASRRLLGQSSVLVDLAKSEQLSQSDFKAFSRVATEVAASTLGVERVGIWFFSEDRSRLRCRNLYELPLDRHSSGVEVEAERYPRYFAALERGRVVAAHDARDDPDTSEFSESYLVPLDIYSMLDAPIRKEGKLVGVVCHEHVGAPRVWAADEQDFAASVADFVSLALEASERRKAEQAYRVAQEELLRQQWQARNQIESELDGVRDELIRQTRMAAIGQVAASIADELRSPLAAIREAESRLESRLPEPTPECSEELAVIADEVGHANAIVDNLVEISRGREPRKQRVDLEAAVHEAFAAVAEASRMRLHLELHPDPFLFDADPEQLRLLLSNLIANAAQATEGRGALRVEAGVEGGVRVLKVSDDGPGVPDDRRGRIFEPLYTTKPGGTGLGLTICRQVAERHGWKIELAPSDGGTLFRVTLGRS